jgi:signal peptidase I
MFSYFAPRYRKDGRAVYKNGHKLLAYKRDLLNAEEQRGLEKKLDALRDALRGRDRQAIEGATRDVDRTFTKQFPVLPDAGWRENCEVFIIAILIALAVRTYFIQPFTIPTGSMQPTLNGIIGHPTTEPPPNFFARVAQFAIFGRSYINVVSEVDDHIVELNEAKRFLFFTYTEIRCANRDYSVHASKATLMQYFLGPPRPYRAGEAIARGYIDTGDHVFVDKISYNFSHPKRGQVFVFNTTNIGTNENVHNPGAPSQFYIKRLAGLPDDELKIAPPELFINGNLASGFGFERVMRSVNGYYGYSNGPAGGYHFKYLGEPDRPFLVPEHNYFALGDNSYHSSDSRDWGLVPQENLMGRGLFVYWPFMPHFGFIR